MENGIIILRHDDAQVFFKSASHPDSNELQRRDRFLAQIEEQVQFEDDTLTSFIPDIKEPE